MRRLIVSATCLVILSAISIAQSTPGYHIQEYTTDNGMPSNGIKGMQWDEKTGFLWIATEAGMTRFNGMGFTNFTKENTAAISHERIYFLVKNSNDQIIGADAGSNIFMVSQNILVPQPRPKWKGVNLLRQRFFYRLNNDTLEEKLLEINKLTADSGWLDLLRYEDGSFILTLTTGRYYYYSSGENKISRLVIPPAYGEPFVIRNQLYVIGKDGRIYAARDNFGSFRALGLQTKSGEQIVLDASNHLVYTWESAREPILFSGNNAWYLRENNGMLEAELICAAVPSTSFIRVAQYSRKNKTLFIGTDSKGIIVIQENRVTPFKNRNTDIRERNAYYSQVELSNGNVLTNEGHIIGPSENKITELPITGKFDFSVFTNGDSLLWYTQYASEAKTNVLHLYNYKSKSKKVFRKAYIISNFAMTAHQGRFYIATTSGLGWLEGDSIHYVYHPPATKKEIAPPIAMMVFSENKLGVASCDGLILYSLHEKRTDTLLKPFGYCLRSLWKYKDYVFIGSYGNGFYIYKGNGEVRSMPLDKNKFLLYTHCFMPDNKGFVWMSTNRGLFKAQLSDLLDAYEKKLSGIYYHYFGKNDGMEITEMNGGCSPCALALKNNNLSFPTMDGLLWVNPEKANPLFPEGNIFLDEFIAGRKKISPDSIAGRSFPSASKDIFIRLGFSAWCNKENIYLEYQVNKNGEWIPVDIEKGAAITLYNLPPGSYHISIRKLNGFGSNNYSYKEINFSINTPWTRKWWFYLICAGLLFGAVTLYLQFRTRQYKIRQRKLEQQVFEKTKELQNQNQLLEKNNTIKTRLISIISHDIITPLKFLTTAGKNLLEKRKMMSEPLQDETIQEITNTSQELQLLSTNILNWIKYQNENRLMVKERFDLSEMVNQVIGILKSLARQKNLLLENRVQENSMVYQFYEPLKILVYNLLTNAIQFTEKGKITVDLKISHDLVTITVSDQGIGMSPEQVQRLMGEEVVITSANVDNKKGHGLGYLIIKDLIKTMNARLSIDSRKDHGTRVSVSFPGAGNNNLPGIGNKL